jgi:hypothetical protein
MRKLIRLHQSDALTLPLADGATLRLTPFRDSPYVTLAFFGPGGGDAGGVILRAERARLLASWLYRLADECGTPTAVLRRLKNVEGDPAAGTPELVGDIPQDEAPSLDDDETLASFARLATPLFADVCVIDLMDEDHVVRRLPLAHADPMKGQAARALRKYPPDLKAPHPRSEVFRSGNPYVNVDVVDSHLEAVAVNNDHLEIMRGLGCRSSIGVPLVTRGRVLGGATFVRTVPDRRFSEADLPAGLAFARRVALAVDNARLYREAQAVLTTEIGNSLARRGGRPPAP